MQIFDNRIARDSKLAANTDAAKLLALNKVVALVASDTQDAAEIAYAEDQGEIIKRTDEWRVMHCCHLRP